jgi:hypothetical protein
VRDLLAGYAEQAQEAVEDGGRVGRWLGRVGVEPAQVDEQHPVERRLAGEEVSGVDGELGFADPGHPLNRGDHDCAAIDGAVVQGVAELVQFGGAAGEIDQIGWQPVLGPYLCRCPGFPADHP